MITIRMIPLTNHQNILQVMIYLNILILNNNNNNNNKHFWQKYCNDTYSKHYTPHKSTNSGTCCYKYKYKYSYKCYYYYYYYYYYYILPGIDNSSLDTLQCLPPYIKWGMLLTYWDDDIIWSVFPFQLVELTIWNISTIVITAVILLINI